MEEEFRNFIRTNHLTDKWEEFMKENKIESHTQNDLKRVYVTQDADGDNYVIPYELKEYFAALNSSFGLPHNISSEMIEHLEEKRAAMDEAFEKEFSKYATGGDINLIELYARI